MYGEQYFESDFRCGSAPAPYFSSEKPFAREAASALKLVRELTGKAGGRLLEIGCAGGWLLKAAREVDVGIFYQEREDAELQWLNGSQVTGITYIEKGSNEVKLLSASKLDINLLGNATAAGVLYQDHATTDVQLLPGSMVVGMLYEETKAPGVKLLRAAHPELELISGHNVRGLLYQEQGSAEVKLLSDTSDLSIANGAKVAAILYRAEV
jgi:hypothetical protein